MGLITRKIHIAIILIEEAISVKYNIPIKRNSTEIVNTGHLQNTSKAQCLSWPPRGRRDRDRMVVGFTTTYAISA
jgi:hypothetical protein